ncbi:MAG: methionine synthase [Actinomycetota bacterium]|nr:methionine synthase [Actinomycetota bacterium]
MPGTDPREAMRFVLGELPDLPHLVELPARGPGADVIGRTAGALVDLHVDLQPAGWRLVPRPGRDERRGAALLGEDLDALEEAADGWRGPLKVQLAGPWTLAAALDLPRGEKALSDPGACRDLADSLAEAAALHVAEVRRRVPGAHVVLQLDEPMLPAVLGSLVPTASGYGVLRTPEQASAESGLAAVIERAGVPAIVHCCARDVPIALLQRAGAVGISVDFGLLDRRADEALGEALEAGVAPLAGLVPAVGRDTAGDVGRNLSEPTATVEPVRRLWRRLGLDPGLVARSVVVTPTCGLAGASPAHARGALATARAAARVLAEDPE